VYRVEELARYNFKIVYRQRHINRKPDALSRHLKYYQKRKSLLEDNIIHPIMTILHLKNFRLYDIEYNDDGIAIISAAQL
jgi:hypothetical protein